MALRAHVRKGRLILDEPTNLPEGTVVDLAMDDEGDDFTPAERKRLERQLRTAWDTRSAVACARPPSS